MPGDMSCFSSPIRLGCYDDYVVLLTATAAYAMWHCPWLDDWMVPTSIQHEKDSWPSRTAGRDQAPQVESTFLVHDPALHYSK